MHCLDLAAGWVQECSNEHEECIDGHDESFPTRILDVGTSGDTVTLGDGATKSGYYVCLSYCVRNTPSHFDTIVGV